MKQHPIPGATPSASTDGTARPRVNLALQGGGSHGAFTWGVLDEGPTSISVPHAERNEAGESLAAPKREGTRVEV